jgi:hypothetical protein
MTDAEWLKMMAEREDGGFVSVGGLVYSLEHPYPREEAAAAAWGLHPHEARPRSGETFLHERLTFLRESAALREHIETLNRGVRQMLEKACVLIDGTQGWYFGCRYCGKLGPVVSLKHEAHEEHIPHKPDCLAVRMRDLVTSTITKL